jgi:phosphatidate phosphatase APP1
MAAVATADTALKSDEHLILFPALAQVTPDGRELELTVRGWIFEPERRAATLATVQRLLDIPDEELAGDGGRIFQDRARPFLYDNERGKRVELVIGAHTMASARSDANGHFSTTMRVPRADTSGVLSVTASLGVDRDPQIAPVYVLENGGISVISDIDDTIKVSDVTDRKALVRNTFLEPFQPVAGMADVYRAWSARGASFHYVTASPWQLFTPLAQFTRDHGFPAGSFHMKSFRVKDRTFFSLFASPIQYKLDTIEPLLQRFAGRRFVLVGDSGEKDPEIYGQLARKYPGQIAAVYIRELGSDDAQSPRYRAAFAGVPASRCQVFHDPREVLDALPWPP